MASSYLIKIESIVSLYSRQLVDQPAALEWLAPRSDNHLQSMLLREGFVQKKRSDGAGSEASAKQSTLIGSAELTLQHYMLSRHHAPQGPRGTGRTHALALPVQITCIILAVVSRNISLFSFLQVYASIICTSIKKGRTCSAQA